MNNITQEHSQITQNKPSTAKGDTKFISRPGDNEPDMPAKTRAKYGSCK